MPLNDDQVVDWAALDARNHTVVCGETLPKGLAEQRPSWRIEMEQPGPVTPLSPTEYEAACKEEDTWVCPPKRTTSFLEWRKSRQRATQADFAVALKNSDRIVEMLEKIPKDRPLTDKIEVGREFSPESELLGLFDKPTYTIGDGE